MPHSPDSFVAELPHGIPIHSTGHLQDTTIDSATTLTPPAGTTHLVVQVTSASKNARYRLDGGTPTASLGFVLVAQADPLILPCFMGYTFIFIAETSGAVIDYCWLKGLN
jgi:hypothetical protein